jgi:translocation and assembly module TamA
VEASWQNRNFINPEGALTLRGIAGTREQLVGVQFRRNNFGARDRVFELHLAASNSQFDAFEARTLRFLASLERQSNIIWRKTWTWGSGPSFWRQTSAACSPIRAEGNPDLPDRRASGTPCL